MKERIEEILKVAGVAPTPVRILIYGCIEKAHLPVSLSDIEISLESVDKSTISRTLNLFKDNHLIHSINDGSGAVKYEICKSHGKEVHDDQHVHFRCEKCGVTICFNFIKIPEVDLPTGFMQHETSYVITGVCPKCSS